MRLLIIEDEVDLLQGMVRAFRDQGDEVDTAEDGADGLYKSINRDYDVIVLDAMLPGLDGWEILQRLRTIRNTPVLMLTARDGARDRVHGLDLGADDYMVKPFELKELLARLRALQRRGPDLNRSTVEIREVTVNLKARVVIRDGIRVPLTEREYGLVEYLAVRRSQVVPRQDLCEHLFAQSQTSAKTLLRSHVANVCRKLGPGFIRESADEGLVVD